MSIAVFTDVPNMWAWLSSDAVTGLSDNDNMPATWTDQSGAGHDFTCSATKPKWRSGASGLGPNGGPALAFNGNSSIVAPSAYTSLTAATIFIVTKTGTPYNSGRSLWAAGGGGGHEHYAYNDTNLYENWGSSSRRTISSISQIANWTRYRLVSGTNDYQIAMDEVNKITPVTSHTPSGFSSGLTIGTGYAAYTGLVSAVLIWSRALNSTELADVSALLAPYMSGGTTAMGGVTPVGQASETDTARTIYTLHGGNLIYRNVDPSSVKTIATSGAETIITGMDIDNLAAVPTRVDISVHASMSSTGEGKETRYRLRDGGLTGTILADSNTKSATVDSTAGDDTGFRWTHAATYTPANGRLVLTVDSSTNTNPNTYSNLRTFDISQMPLQALGQASVALTAQAFGVVGGGGATQNVTVNQASETDTGQAMTPVTGAVSVTAGQASETDTGQSVTPVAGTVSASLGQAVETDTGQALTPVVGGVNVAVGQAEEADSASTLSLVGGAVTEPIAQAASTESAGTLTPSFDVITVSLDQAVETDSAPSLTPLLGPTTIILDRATETDSAGAMTPSPGAVTISVDQASETSTAQPLTPIPGTLGVLVGRATSFETAATITPAPGSVAIAIGQAVETDFPNIVNPYPQGVAILITTATETSIAHPVDVFVRLYQYWADPGYAVAILKGEWRGPGLGYNPITLYGEWDGTQVQPLLSTF